MTAQLFPMPKMSRRSTFVWLLRLACGALAAWALFLFAVTYSNTITPTGIIVHHSAVPLSYVDGALDATTLDEIHRQRGFGISYWGRTYHIGYHYLILPDGTVQQGRPERCQGAHARGYNSYLGICLIGGFSKENNLRGELGPKEPTAAQMHALSELCRRLQERYNIPAHNVLRHHDVNVETECPGDQFPLTQLREQLIALLGN
jgi:hypothetical protein